MSIKISDVYKEIDFPVEKRPLKVIGNNNEILDMPINNIAIVRKDTNQVLSVMSNRYNLILHRHTFDKALEYIGKTKLDYKIDKVKTYQGGAQMHIEFTLPKYHVVFDKQDKIDFRLIFKNSYDGSWTFDFSCGFFRQICSNGLTVGEILEKIRKKHTPKMNVEDAVENIMLMIEKTHSLGMERLTTLKKSKITVERGNEIVNELFEKKNIWPKKYHELVRMNFANKIYAYTNNSLFDVYNAFTRELNAMEDKNIHIDRIKTLNMKAFDSVWQYV